MRIYISDVLKYYSIELEKLKKNVDECNVNALDSIDFFLKEANTYDKGIPLDIETTGIPVRFIDLRHVFKFWKPWNEPWCQ